MKSSIEAPVFAGLFLRAGALSAAPTEPEKKAPTAGEANTETPASGAKVKYEWGIPEGGKGSPKCRSSLLSIIKEKDDLRAFDLFKRSGKKCQHAAFIDEDACAEGCDYGVALINIVDGLIRMNRLDAAREAVRLGLTFDENITFEIGGDGYVLRQELLERDKKLSKPAGKKPAKE